MRKTLRLLIAAVVGIAAVSCGSTEQMAKLADNVVVTCDPPVLEAVNGKIDADVTVTYPKGYFNPKVILEVTPVIVHERGETKGTPFVYQGTKVKDNYTVVSSNGQSVTEHLEFNYTSGMEKCYLELRGVVVTTKKSIYLPFKKVADGCNTTYMLVKKDGSLTLKKDQYRGYAAETTEGQIKYLVNSAEVRKSELNGSSLKDFVAALESIKSDDRARVSKMEIVSYASPEGAVDFNNKLSEKRAASATKVWDQLIKDSKPSVRSVGEDWEGFQKLVRESNIQDKELILRVLSMYSDPVVRETEIRNMSQVFLVLKDRILPELRRSRFIATIEYENYDPEELLEIVDDNLDVLDEEALLHGATLVKKDSDKEALYRKAIDKYKSDRAQYNLGVLYLEQNKDTQAESTLKRVKSKDADLNNALGVLALHKGDYDSAARYFRSANNDDARANRGIIDILTGDYEQAAKDLANVKGCCHNTALAYILTKQYDKASAAIHCECAKCTYLKAIIAARTGDAAGVQKYLEEATLKDEDLRLRAPRDIEFAAYSF